MIDNNPVFSQDNIKRLCAYLSEKAYVLAYDANDTDEQHEAAEKLYFVKFLMAHMADHFFGYFPASYFLSDVQRQDFADFIDDLKQDPKLVVEIIIGFVDNAFDEINHIEYPEDEQYRKPRRDKIIEKDIKNFLLEIYRNLEEFNDKLHAEPQNKDKSKPSETRLKTLINTISSIQEYLLSQGEFHKQLIQAFQFSKMLELYKSPLLFAWEQFKYGWHSDFWKEDDSMWEYEMFILNAQEHLDKCLYLLKLESPFKYFEVDGQITSDLIDIISDIRKQFMSGQLNII